jgi:hypothetical protein
MRRFVSTRTEAVKRQVRRTRATTHEERGERILLPKAASRLSATSGRPACAHNGRSWGKVRFRKAVIPSDTMLRAIHALTHRLDRQGIRQEPGPALIYTAGLMF